MAGGGAAPSPGSAKARELDQTPTWAVSAVCAVIVLISILLEKALHFVAKVFQRKKKKHMLEALEKLKGELMVLGFISLLLTFGQSFISKICIPERYADTMLPCPHRGIPQGAAIGGGDAEESAHHRRLLWYEHRILVAHDGKPGCKQPGHVPLISLNGLHQLHIFIFFLAVFHVIYSVITMTLGRLKIREWKEWERESDTDHEYLNDPSRFRLTHETSFVRDHMNVGTRSPVIFYIICFFRQFYRSVRKADYLTMRHGFVTVHLAPGSKFDFQKYIKRSLEDDFKVILAVDTKLQAVIATMAIEIQERHAVIQGIPLVQVSDRNFWFGWPQLILYLIHFVLFQNAFEITYFIWTTYEFGIWSCFHDHFPLVVLRVCFGFVAQFVCSYITLPLYALVTQMGTTMKRSIFDEQTSKALKQWHKKAVQKKNEVKPLETPTLTLGEGPAHSPVQSPGQNARARVQNNNSSEDAGADKAANIMASVDVTGQQHRSRDENGYNDLLTGP
ncbi:hypothetical protein CDL15_Pgr007194 [Punica granatum]|uniref:MLO-like protein n=1 Tax=Punica granatum TaxID=22663 RepID=A0A218X8A3_PUNGR|nr:hypothetical protein CDL15_Pgr007194 [Punica granatum]